VDIRELLNWYGGLGSFSDVVLGGMSDAGAGVHEDDRELRELSAAIYATCTKIRRILDRLPPPKRGTN
jgi:hypothetical protein